MTQLNALEGLFMSRGFNLQPIAYSHICVEVPIDLNTAIYHLTRDDNFLAEALCAPSKGGGVTHIALSHEIVQLVAVKWEHILGIYQIGKLLVGKFGLLRVNFILAKNGLNDLDVVIGDLAS
jgi:hypothetical protein